MSVDPLERLELALSTRWGETKMEPSKDRIAALLDLLGSPQRAFRAIHLTGTNGKTSTARMIDELVRAFGLRTGRFTSPHLTSLTERIVLDGEPIAPAALLAAYDEIAPLLDIVDEQSGVRLSFFEVLVALAFSVFADAPIDVAVVEVGLGGRWDATNVLDAEVAVVTPIGLDHMQYLGPTVVHIAKEKAGIISAGSIAILASQPAEAAAELLRQAVEVGATVAREGLEFGVRQREVAVGGQVLTLQGLGGLYDGIFLPLHGAHQAQNAACALAAVEALLGAGAGAGSLDLEIVREAFAAVSSPGRLEAVRASPTVLVDAAHNPHGMTATVEALHDSFDFHRLIGVVAMMADKDVDGVLALLEPVLDEIVVTQNSSPRCMAADDLATIAVGIFGVDRVTVEPHLDDAISTAIELAESGSDDSLSGTGVIVTGSVVTAGEARVLLGAR
ncbi:MAG: FolC bifunctional protein [Pseudonocardiales bacterium]|nr:FolC bifunctional protein [Jatrophihabitantaceae bacterium]MCW2603695.1 FolC bifunctional protein [Pseudonocardiales bacterium]